MPRDPLRTGAGAQRQPDSEGPKSGWNEGTHDRVETAMRVTGRYGTGLPPEVRSYFEPRFQYDFGRVRVHADGDAAGGARAIEARAYTLGRDIVFGSGEYAPGTVEGRRLLAHELTHVVQQDGGRAAGPRIRRQPKASKKSAPAKFKPRKVTQEDVVKEMTGLGGPYADLKAWEDTIQPGTFLGHAIDAGSSPIKGVRPEFQKLLDGAAAKVKDEFKKSGNTIPKGFGIRSIGGFRQEISPHGAGVAIDIDAGENPYIMHESDGSGETTLSKELRPVYHRIAEFILNDPIDGEQSVIPKTITTDANLPKGSKVNRRDRVGQFYDRLSKESGAMQRYFTLMKDDVALKAYLGGDWKTLHPGESPPAVDDIRKQMWEDYALLGGDIPKGGPAGVSGFTAPRAAGRPFHPTGGGQKDPVAGFLTLPREVVLGLGQVVPRWGAMDFGPESGDVMHFDDRYGIGKPFFDAVEPAKVTVAAENKTAEEAFNKAAAEQAEKDKAEKDKADADKAGSGSGSGSAVPQRKAILGAVDDPLEREADETADRVMGMNLGAGEGMEASRRGVPQAHTTEGVGTPLPPEARAYFEPRFGYDFSTVRLHANRDADEAARGMRARAFTVGRDIVFGSGEYAPATVAGRRLIAHELAHVVQQGSGASNSVVRRSIRPADIGVEMVGQTFHLRKAFSDGAVNIPAGEIVTVVSWSNTSNTAQVSSASAKVNYGVPKYLLEPEQTKVAGVAPYGVGLGKAETLVETGAAKLEAFKKTEPEYKTAKGKAYFAKELGEGQTEQTRVETALNVRLIQATMINRFDGSIKKWVDFYNTQFGFKAKDALDPNLIKAMVYQESQMGTFGDFMSDPAANPIMTRFNILQAIDSWPEEQLLVLPEIVPSLIKKYHLENIQQDLLQVETEFDTLNGKVKAGRAKDTDVARLEVLKTQSAQNWQPWFIAYTAPGETKGFREAAEEFLNGADSGKTRKDGYDFWIRVGVRAVFEKHKQVSSWAEAARAYNGGGPKARRYRDEVVERAEGAAKAEKAGKEFVPARL